MTNRIFAVALTGVLASGCASVQTTRLADDSTTTLKGKTVARTVHKSPTFMAVTPGKGAFAAIGAIAMAKTGNALVEKHRIADPAGQLGAGLQGVMQSQFDVRAVSGSAVTVASDDIETIRRSAGNADLVLDVKTIGWGFAYDGFKFSDYAVNAAMDVRLIDVQTGKVLASSRCTSPVAEKDQMSTHDELLANDAALIKRKLSEVADYCTQSFAADVLGVAAAGSALATTD